MKKSILTTTLLSSILFIVGCKKNDNLKKAFNEKSSFLNIPYSFFFDDDDTIPSHGLISFSSTKFGFDNSSTITPIYNFNADFFDDENKLPSDRIEVGTLSNGLYSLSADVSNDLNYTYNSVQKNSSNNSSLFGNTLIFSASGSTAYSIPSFADTLYNPNDLLVTGSFNGGVHNTHSKSDPIQINWNSDNNNTNDKIYIVLQYIEGPSKRINSSNPSNVALKYYIVDDSDGSFTISSSELSSFPDNCVLNLHIFRGNGVVKKVNNLYFDILVYSHVQQEFDLTL
jgi:hypothetical protein